MTRHSSECPPLTTDMLDLLELDHCRESNALVPYINLFFFNQQCHTICLAQYFQRIYAVLPLVRFKSS